MAFTTKESIINRTENDTGQNSYNYTLNRCMSILNILFMVTK